MRGLIHLWVMFIMVQACHGMFHKKQRIVPREVEEDPEKDFRADLEDLLLSNDVSGARSSRLFQKAHKYGEQLGSHTFRAHAKASSSGSNAHRNLLKKMLKQCKWPCKLYNVQVRVWNVKRQREETVWLPILLPHEMIKGLSNKSSMQALLCNTGMSRSSLDHLKALEQQFATLLIGLGLWGDGVPCNYDKSQSLDVWSINLPGLAGPHGALRLPVTVVNTRFVLLHKTHDDILAVIKWSLEQCILGTMPSTRHDGSPWQPEDNKRRGLAGTQFPPAALCEVRGDWKFYKQVFRFPQHNELAGCCWMCNVTPGTFRNVGADAGWRTNRLDHWQLLARMNDLGCSRSPLFGAPGVRSSIFQVDWLHTADKGVTAAFLGSLFNLLRSKMPGDTKVIRLQALFLELQAWYSNNPSESKLDNLTPGMIGPQTGPYSLKAKAAEARSLVPFAVFAADRWLSKEDPMESTVLQAAVQLQACYNQLSRASFSAEVLKEHSRKFCLLSVALEEFSSDMSWHLRPKLHLFKEV